MITGKWRQPQELRRTWVVQIIIYVVVTIQYVCLLWLGATPIESVEMTVLLGAAAVATFRQMADGVRALGPRRPK